MAKQVISDFTSWEFDDSEVLQACTLTDLNIKYLQNELNTYAEEQALIALPETGEHTTYLLAVQFIKGKIAAIKYLLAMHDTAMSALRKDAELAIAKAAFDRSRNPNLSNPDLNQTN